MHANTALLNSDVQSEKGERVVLQSESPKPIKPRLQITLRSAASGNPEFCCVTAIRNYSSSLPNSAHYFFRHTNRSSLKRSQFSGGLVKAIHRLALPAYLYPSYSFFTQAVQLCWPLRVYQKKR